MSLWWWRHLMKTLANNGCINSWGFFFFQIFTISTHLSISSSLAAGLQRITAWRSGFDLHTSPDNQSFQSVCIRAVAPASSRMRPIKRSSFYNTNTNTNHQHLLDFLFTHTEHVLGIFSECKVWWCICVHFLTLQELSGPVETSDRRRKQ